MEGLDGRGGEAKPPSIRTIGERNEVVSLPLEFHNDAICLSGGTGTELKSEILGSYYPFWWKITSGGGSVGYLKPTAIVDMDAATGEVYLKDKDETVLGTAGHALQLKLGGQNTEKLKVILVERDDECYARLRRVIHRRWSQLPLEEAEGAPENNTTGVYLLHTKVDDAIPGIEKIAKLSDLGRSIFLFDPLRSVEWAIVQKAASQRITTFYKIGTEFIIFLFTSDLFLGRDEYSALPETKEENQWSEKEIETVSEVDKLLGTKSWQPLLLRKDPIRIREERLVDLYKRRLYSWFRYILPLPFAPKPHQIYHLFVCSNFEVGIRATRNSFFCPRTKNEQYSPDIEACYQTFQQEHPSRVSHLREKTRPIEFRILWKVIREHEEGFCDVMCQDLMKIERDFGRRRQALEWLRDQGYIKTSRFDDEWGAHAPTFMLNWPFIENKLGVKPPAPLRPLLPNETRL